MFKSYQADIHNLPQDFAATHNGVFRPASDQKPVLNQNIYKNIPITKVVISSSPGLDDFENMMATHYTHDSNTDVFTNNRESYWNDQHLINLPNQPFEIYQQTGGMAAKFSTFGNDQNKGFNNGGFSNKNLDQDGNPLSHHFLTNRVKQIQKKNGQVPSLSRGSKIKKSDSEKSKGVNRSIDFEDIKTEFSNRLNNKRKSKSKTSQSWRNNTGMNGRITPASDSIKSQINFNASNQFLRNKSMSQQVSASNSLKQFTQDIQKNRADKYSGQVPNYEYLDKLHTSSKGRKTELRKEYERINQSKQYSELIDCTFQPQINYKKQFKTNLNFNERQSRWLQAKEERTYQVKELIEKLEQEKCNFEGVKATKLKGAQIVQNRIE